jgi:RNA polymerase sigma-70 factor (ECF subfamily)
LASPVAVRPLSAGKECPIPAPDDSRESDLSKDQPNDRGNRPEENGCAPTAVDWLDRHGDYLYRYALLRLRHAQDAEDLVQETLLAGFRARERFAGRSAVRSWLTAILKRKIVDWHRAKGRRERALDPRPAEDFLDDLFDERGKWRVSPTAWETAPEALLERKEFWQVLRRCLGRLPARLAHVFTLREIEERSNKDVRQTLQVSPSNLWVLLHRARVGLSRCLDLHWFGRSRRK